MFELKIRKHTKAIQIGEETQYNEVWDLIYRGISECFHNSGILICEYQQAIKDSSLSMK